ncbi:MAG: polysaccharide deacetylase family protein [Anaerolineaceae bacterium]|nr:polysaccharide deacetylase family protein [Anaerolineaceae bacterium]
MKSNPVLKKLGFAADDRLVIIHTDDIGMCQASVDAFADLHAFGLISSGAVMMPCSWAPHAAAYYRDHPTADLGVHLTLTCEWRTYRWGPMSTRDPKSGMLDAEGYFPRTSEEIQEKGVPEFVQQELAVQVARARAFGMNPTHIDTHMGSVAHPKFMQAYVGLGIAEKLPIMLFRKDKEEWLRTRPSMGEETAAQAATISQQLEEMGIPLLDEITGLELDADPTTRLDQAKSAFSRLGAGVTHFIIHPAKNTPELRAITPGDWQCRAADYETFKKEELRDYLKDIGVQVVSYQMLKDLIP